ncbi:hypothetical protein V8D89_013589 [Ganoderma adspersum]
MVHRRISFSLAIKTVLQTVWTTLRQTACGSLQKRGRGILRVGPHLDQIYKALTISYRSLYDHSRRSCKSHRPDPVRMSKELASMPFYSVCNR